MLICFLQKEERRQEPENPLKGFDLKSEYFSKYGFRGLNMTVINYDCMRIKLNLQGFQQTSTNQNILLTQNRYNTLILRLYK